MIIDTNAYLGHFALRQLRHNTADGLLRLMDEKGIDRAMVSSASAIMYRNAQSGNEEVAAEVKAHRDRLIPLAVLNPFYAGWQDDLAICHDEFGMKGLRLYPKWHNYTLSDACCLDLVDRATERGMIVSIPTCVEDTRQNSWIADVGDVPLEELVALVRARPKARFVFLNGRRYAGSPLGQKDNGLPAKYWIEISRLSALMDNEMGELVARLGADRVVFGSGMPFKYPEPSLLKVEVLDVPVEVKQKILFRNAAALLQPQR